MSFMQPVIEKSSYWELDTDNGTEIVPTDVQDFTGEFWDDEREAFTAEFLSAFSMFVHGTINQAERKTGYISRLSAPGYMDATDWNRADTLPEAIGDLVDSYGDSFDSDDWHTVGDELEGFDEFWRGYLYGLAFTAHSGPDGADDPFNAPGQDIRDVVDVDDIESKLAESACLVKCLAACVDFFLKAHELIAADSCQRNNPSGDWESAGSDFHLTRNGHGCGFWDGDWPLNGDKLTEISKTFGEAELMVENDTYYVE